MYRCNGGKDWFDRDWLFVVANSYVCVICFFCTPQTYMTSRPRTQVAPKTASAVMKVLAESLPLDAAGLSHLKRIRRDDGKDGAPFQLRVLLASRDHYARTRGALGALCRRIEIGHARFSLFDSSKRGVSRVPLVLSCPFPPSP